MDKRWKAVERKTAAKLNEVLSDIGKFSPIERIPLLGRDGPDLTINESELVINVKSRKAIPDRLFPEDFQLLFCRDLVIFRLSDLSCFNTTLMGTTSTDKWKQLQDWYDHMDTWTKAKRPEGVSAIFLHRPRMPIGKTGVAIHFNDIRRLQCHLSN